MVAIAPNLLEHNFTVENINKKIVGDITYINTSDSGWCYLASFLDLHNNEICGWEFSKNMITDIVIKALKKLVSDVKKSYQKQLFIRIKEVSTQVKTM